MVYLYKTSFRENSSSRSLDEEETLVYVKSTTKIFAFLSQFTDYNVTLTSIAVIGYQITT